MVYDVLVLWYNFEEGSGFIALVKPVLNVLKLSENKYSLSYFVDKLTPNSLNVSLPFNCCRVALIFYTFNVYLSHGPRL